MQERISSKEFAEYMAFYSIEPSAEDKNVAYLKQVAFHVEKASGVRVGNDLSRYDLSLGKKPAMSDAEIINARKQWRKANKELFAPKKKRRKT